MKILLLISFILSSFFSLFAQYDYAVSSEFPYGQLNPEAPKQTADYKELIGICDCTSISRKQDGTWAEPVKMEWKFKYILNGMGVQDETLKMDGSHSGSIRQYNKDSLQWYVHYYTSTVASPNLRAWKGNRTGDEIILYNKQAAPNGTPGFHKIRFYDISTKGFKWLGAWVNTNETFSYETWKIDCVKREED